STSVKWPVDRGMTSIDNATPLKEGPKEFASAKTYSVNIGHVFCVHIRSGPCPAVCNRTRPARTANDRHSLGQRTGVPRSQWIEEFSAPHQSRRQHHAERSTGPGDILGNKLGFRRFYGRQDEWNRYLLHRYQ